MLALVEDTIQLQVITIMTYHMGCNKSNTTGATNGPGTASRSWVSEVTPRIFVGFGLLDF
jgi:hypothetical protein